VLSPLNAKCRVAPTVFSLIGTPKHLIRRIFPEMQHIDRLSRLVNFLLLSLDLLHKLQVFG
jgi:hypothetical protein